jgi:DNA-binding XRE family transcriptional regulator/molybdate-binding protein
MNARIRELREERVWSQQELAEKAGVTRQLVSTVEAGRHSPNVMAALGLARAFGISVEELFSETAKPVEPALGQPISGPVVACRVGDRLMSVPMVNSLPGPEQWGFADAFVGPSGTTWLPDASFDGLLVAGCDPVLGMLAAMVQRTSGRRIVTTHASSGRSAEALKHGRVHGAVVHARRGELPTPPKSVRRWHLASWQVGLASAQRSGPPTVEELASRRRRVVQRDADAGSQQAFRRALVAVGVDTALPGPIGQGHLDVARRVRNGDGLVGVTMEAAATAFELSFAPLETHIVELWIDRRWADNPAAMALLDTLSSAGLRARVDLLTGYDTTNIGTEQTTRKAAS